MEEIKAGDIMIGNYIRDIHSENGFFKVAEIRKDKVLYGNYFKAKFKDIRPIPLTEDILLKAGAKKIEENNVVIMINDPSTHLILMKVGTHWYPQIEQTGEFFSDGVNTVHLNFIDYVHQAQILFKSLTGNDLKIQA